MKITKQQQETFKENSIQKWNSITYIVCSSENLLFSDEFLEIKNQETKMPILQ